MVTCNTPCAHLVRTTKFFSLHRTIENSKSIAWVQVPGKLGWKPAAREYQCVTCVCVHSMHDTCTSTQILFQGESLFRWSKCYVTGLCLCILCLEFGMEASRTGIDGVKNVLPWRWFFFWIKLIYLVRNYPKGQNSKNISVYITHIPEPIRENSIVKVPTLKNYSWVIWPS